MSRTKTNIDGRMMDDSLKFDIDTNPHIKKATKALSSADKECFPPFGIIRGYTSASDTNNPKIIHFFLRLSDFGHTSEEKKAKFFSCAAKKFKEAGFEVLIEEDINGYTYFHVGFYSHHYMIQENN